MKIKSKLKNINKYIILVLISFLITSTIVGVSAATILESSEVSYTNNSQSTVEGALDDLYSKGKLKKYTINDVYLDYKSDSNCGAFKTDTSNTSWVNIIKSTGADKQCNMYYELGEDFNSVSIKYIFIKFTTDADDFDRVKYNGGTHYLRYLYLYYYSHSNHRFSYPAIFKSNTGLNSTDVSLYIIDNKLKLIFYRDASDGNNFQIRGEPKIYYAEIYYE